MNVFEMPTSKVLPLLKAKALKKERTQDEFHAVVSWLTGYGAEDIEAMMDEDVPYGDFFRNAPALIPAALSLPARSVGSRWNRLRTPLCGSYAISTSLWTS